jgi:hypothetical protein
MQLSPVTAAPTTEQLDLVLKYETELLEFDRLNPGYRAALFVPKEERCDDGCCCYSCSDW